MKLCTLSGNYFLTHLVEQLQVLVVLDLEPPRHPQLATEEGGGGVAQLARKAD